MTTQQIATITDVETVIRGDVPANVSPRPAPLLSLFEAMNELDGTGRPFLFFADLASGEGVGALRRKGVPW
jgi:hypothetical protein